MKARMARYKFLSIVLLVMTVECIDSSELNSTLTEEPNNENLKLVTRSEEKRLLSDLFKRYDSVGRMGRPVLDSSTTVEVKFGLGLIQLDLDEKSRILTLSMWTRYEWTDEYLQWNTTEYGNVSIIHVDHELFWKPDIMLYNTAEVKRTFRDSQAIVNSNGVVQWYPHTIFSSSCSVDVTNFPFDEQECHMWFGSWTHNSKEIDLHMGFPQGIDLSTFQSDYKESCSWEISNVTAERTNEPSEEVQPNFVILKFHLYLKRKHVLSTYILTLPCIFLACLSVVVFWLPPERPDRTGLAMSIFGSLMFLLLILVGAAPPSGSSIPTLGIYYSFNMTIIMFAIILSSMVVNISKSDEKPVPRWLYYILSCRMLRCITKLPCPCRGKKRKQKESNSLWSGDHQESFQQAELSRLHDVRDEDSGMSRTIMVDESRLCTSGQSDSGTGYPHLRSRVVDTVSGNMGDVEDESQQALLHFVSDTLPSNKSDKNSSKLLGTVNHVNNHDDMGMVARLNCLEDLNGTRITKSDEFIVENGNQMQPYVESDTRRDLVNKREDWNQSVLCQRMNSVRESVQRIEKRIDSMTRRAPKRVNNQNQQQWKKVSVALDKLFAFLYIVIIIASLLVLFPRPRYLSLFANI